MRLCGLARPDERNGCTRTRLALCRECLRVTHVEGRHIHHPLCVIETQPFGKLPDLAQWVASPGVDMGAPMNCGWLCCQRSALAANWTAGVTPARMMDMVTARRQSYIKQTRHPPADASDSPAASTGTAQSAASCCLAEVLTGPQLCHHADCLLPHSGSCRDVEDHIVFCWYRVAGRTH